DQVFTRAFGGDYDGLQHEMWVYMGRKLLPLEQAPIKPEGELPMAVQRLAPADALYRLGDLLVNVGEPAAAGEHFRAALAIDPRHGLAVAAQGQIEELAGRWPEAQAQYEKAVQLVPGDGFAHFLLGRCLLEQAHRAKAAAPAADGDDGER